MNENFFEAKMRMEYASYPKLTARKIARLPCFTEKLIRECLTLSQEKFPAKNRYNSTFALIGEIERGGKVERSTMKAGRKRGGKRNRFPQAKA